MSIGQRPCIAVLRGYIIENKLNRLALAPSGASTGARARQPRRSMSPMNDRTTRMIATQKRIRAASMATPATPPKPRKAATSAMIKKMMAQ